MNLQYKNGLVTVLFLVDFSESPITSTCPFSMDDLNEPFSIPTLDDNCLRYLFLLRFRFGLGVWTGSGDTSSSSSYFGTGLSDGNISFNFVSFPPVSGDWGVTLSLLLVAIVASSSVRSFVYTECHTQPSMKQISTFESLDREQVETCMAFNSVH